MRKNPAGFTLIELMLSITIVAVMAGLMTAVINPNELRKRVRDAQRKKDLEVVALALEQYYADNNRYPSTVYGGLSSFLSPSSGTQYLRTLPADPTSTYSYCYVSVSSSNFQNYIMCAPLEAVDAIAGTTPDGHCYTVPDASDPDSDVGRHCVVNPL